MGNATQSRFMPLARIALALAIAIPVYAGASPSCFTENFDGVTAPALPNGWTSTVTTSASGTLTAPGTRASGYTASGANAVWFDDYNDYADVSLYSPTYAVGAVAAPSITFQQSYSLWNANASSTYNGAFNGAVLEVSVNGGPYIDLITAGGSYTTGGYAVGLDPNFNNPLQASVGATRQAWGGDSGGFVSTTAVVPPAAIGGTVQFRWRIGTAGGGRGFSTYSGWWVDAVEYETLGDEIFHDDFEGGVPCPH